MPAGPTPSAAVPDFCYSVPVTLLAASEIYPAVAVGPITPQLGARLPPCPRSPRPAQRARRFATLAGRSTVPGSRPGPDASGDRAFQTP
jgi:hypothetical protein